MFIASAIFTACSSDDDNNPTPPENDPFEDGIISGNITSDATIIGGREYTLSGAVYVKPGATLTIEPGAVIKAEYSETSSTAFLAVEMGGKIMAEGTASSPIIFRSGAAQPAAGQWGGIVICGKGITNIGTDVEAEVTGLKYGGTDPSDNSGVLSHIIIEHSGNIITGEKEFNGLTLYAVGSGTKISDIFINQVADDGVEWFGGSVDANNIIVLGAQDDSFDWTDGWVGTATNLYADQSVATNVSSDSRGIEANNTGDNATIEPLSNPTINNLTLIGRNSASVASEAGIMLRVGTHATFNNVYLKDFVAGAGINTNGAEAEAFFAANPLQKVKFDNIKTKSTIAGTFVEDDSATGAGNGAELPDWSTWADAHLSN